MFLIIMASALSMQTPMKGDKFSWDDVNSSGWTARYEAPTGSQKKIAFRKNSVRNKTNNGLDKIILRVKKENGIKS